MQIEQAKNWNKTGMQIARGYADRLDDNTNNCAYSKYFYLLLLFDGDNGTGAIPLSHLKYSIDRLAKRRVSISSHSPLKQLLGDFLSYCTLMFDSENSLNDARDTLKGNRLLPSAVEVLGTQVGAEFVASRYDEVVSQRLGVEWSDKLNFFTKLNWHVMAIGEWFDEKREKAADAMIGISLVLGILLFVITVISTWVEQGFFWGIVSAVILGVIYYFVGTIAVVVLSWMTHLIFWILRYVFYNIFTLLVAIILFILI